MVVAVVLSREGVIVTWRRRRLKARDTVHSLLAFMKEHRPMHNVTVPAEGHPILHVVGAPEPLVQTTVNLLVRTFAGLDHRRGCRWHVAVDPRFVLFVTRIPVIMCHTARPPRT